MEVTAPDADHPDRPTHPDFAIISGNLIALDRAAEDAKETSTFEELLASYIDPDTMTYVAQQRALRIIKRYPQLLIEDLLGVTSWRARFGASWVDGCLQGIQLERSRTGKAGDVGRLRNAMARAAAAQHGGWAEEKALREALQLAVERWPELKDTSPSPDPES